jgi:TPP-dependent pyruvate/acetoin dehydrogenase alpha subunit
LTAEKKSPMTATKPIQSSARVAGKNGFSLISDDTFRELYAALLKCRMLDQRLRTSASYEQWAGREAGSAGVVTCLRSGDSVALTPRGLLVGYLAGGCLPPALNAAKTPVAQLAAATAEAKRHKLEGLGNISVVFAEADKSQRMRDAFAYAARQRLPLIYVLEGSEPSAEACGDVPVIRVDSCDAVAVYRVAHESIMRTREDGGPTIMECAVWAAGREPQDPLKKLERYLAGKELFRQNWKQSLEKKYERILNDAVTSLNSELIKK